MNYSSQVFNNCLLISYKFVLITKKIRNRLIPDFDELDKMAR